MLLYKFRPPEPFQRLADIILRQRLFCSKYEDLNDPFEGQFISIVKRRNPASFPFLATTEAELIAAALLRHEANKPRRKLESIADIGGDTVPRVCSLSSDPSEIRMWSLYADSHRGVAIEIDGEKLVDVLGDSATLHPVDYSESLSENHRYTPSEPGDNSAFPDVVTLLTRKTRHWYYENEYRALSSQRFISIDGLLRRVILGTRATADFEDLVRRLCGPIEVVRAHLDHDAIRVMV